MLIKADKTYHLNHRAYFLSGGKHSSILAASPDGFVSIINLEKPLPDVLKLPSEIRGISFSQTQKLISLIDAESGNLTIMDFQGNILFMERAPASLTGWRTAGADGFDACYFDESQKHFWCLVRLTADSLEIQLRRIGEFSISDKLTLEDPFGESHYSFHETGKPGLVMIWAGGGQDGQQIYWLKTAGEKIIFQEEPVLTDTTPPVFSPNGREFLVISNDENTIYRYQYPNVKTGSCEWNFEDEDDSFETLGYVSENLVLVSTADGLLFLLDTLEMNLIDELSIENHESRPTSSSYSTLKDEKLCTNLSYFSLSGDNFIFVCRRDKITGLHGWQDDLVIIPKEKILAEVSERQSMIKVS